jgi:hypothetical protein
MPVRDLLLGATSAAPAVYVEDVFSTWLYTGTGATQSITNGINLSTKGGMTWIKSRSDATNNNLFDTTQGATKLLHSNTTDSLVTNTVSLTAFNTTGFTLGTGSGTGNEVNVSAATYCSWTFRKQPKFFDVVTYTGTGSNRTISHSLGSVPGMIIVKRTDTTADWQVYHRSLANTDYLVLNSTAASATGATRWNSTTPTSSVFSVGTDTTVNASGGTYVAYIYASNAGGFGLTGTDNVISCGSFGYTGGDVTVNLGFEPQYLMFKYTNRASNWYIYDSMRDFSLTSQSALFANLSAAEYAPSSLPITPTATGFVVSSANLISGDNVIYMAIRRPMKVPTDATTVFSPVATSAVTGTKLTTGFPIDLQMNALRGGWSVNTVFLDRLRGISTNATQSGQYIYSSGTTAEDSGTFSLFWDNTGYQEPSAVGNQSNIAWNFSRRPGFFDEVCYTGTGVARTVTHNLGVVPELMIVKNRGTVVAWKVYVSAIGNTKFMELDKIDAPTTSSTIWNNTTPTSSVFTVGTGVSVNESAGNIVAYLFATCAGVSKVGSYTGNGTTQAIACGFTGGARFVLIKRTDSTGDWYVYDTARGMTTLTDPYLLLNSTVAEAATLGSVTTTTGGFTVNAAILAAINTNAATYIFLAIA